MQVPLSQAGSRRLRRQPQYVVWSLSRRQIIGLVGSMKEHKHGHGHEPHAFKEAQEHPSRTANLVQLGLLYVGIPAVTLYPLGFVGLAIQLWRDPFFPYTDFTTIWVAVALIDETVVIATGIRLIYL
jgi:hypothetical protein